MPNIEEQSSSSVDLNGPLAVASVRAVKSIHSDQDSVKLAVTLEAALDLDFHLSEEWNLACRVAASKGLSKSSLLPRFLLYICEQSLTGNARLLTEQRIGTAIFNRPQDYNPGEDNIVRSYARTLRRRLDEYFEADGHAEAMRITVPRGGYIPVFEHISKNDACLPPQPNEPELSAIPQPNPITEPAIASRPADPTPPMPSTFTASGTPWRAIVGGFIAGVAVALALWFTLAALSARRPQSASHAVWSQLFQQNRDTIIVPADSGLGIVQNLTGHLVPLEEYANGSYLSDHQQVPGIDAASLADLHQQRYTSVVDLDIAARLMQLPESSFGRTEIRFARSITMEDLKTSNVILLGSSHTNPWVSLFAERHNFQLQYTPEVNRSFVLNRQPRSGEQERYVNGTGPTGNQTYGVVEFLPNLEGTGHVLIIQGLNMAATQAAADTLFNEAAMQPVLKQATRPDGTLCPFEILIRTTSIGAANPGSQIIATRIYP